MRSATKNILWIIALAGALALVYRGEIFGGRTFSGPDMIYQNYPRIAFVRDRLISGEVPLWAPNIYMGYPLAAEGQSGIFYPPNLIITCVPKELAPSAVVLLNLLIAALGMFILSRSLGASSRSAALAGLLYAANAFMMSHTQHINIIAAMAWTPIILALTEFGMRGIGRGALFGVFAGTAAAMSVLAGQPQFTLFAALAAAVFLAFRAPAHRAPAARILAFTIPAALTALMLSLPQLLPQLELAGYSIRPGRLSFAAFTDGSLNPGMLPTLLLPHFQGAAWDATYRAGGAPGEMFFTPGLPALILAASALALKRTRTAAPLAILAAIAIPWALGGFTPLAKLIYHIPGLNIFRVPARAMFFLALGIPILAAAGLDALASPKPAQPPATTLLRAAAQLGALAAAAATLALLIFKNNAAAAIASRITSTLHPHAYYIAKSQILITMLTRDTAIAAAALTLAALALHGSRKHANTASWALAALVLIDLSSMSPSFVNSAPRSSLLYTPPAARDLLSGENPGFNRIYTAPPIKYLQYSQNPDTLRTHPSSLQRDIDTLDFELPLLFGINSLNGYGSLSLWDFQTLVQRRRFASIFEDRSKQQPFGGAEKNAGNLDPARDATILRILKVNRVIRPTPGGRSLVMINLKPGKTGLSPFWALCTGDTLRPASTPAAIFFDPALPSPEHSYNPLSFGWRRTASGRIETNIDMPCDGVLVLMEKYYPGWTVTDTTSGRTREIISGELFLGIASPLDKGPHNLQYEFKPDIVDTAITASTASLALLLIFATIALAGGALNINTNRHNTEAPVQSR